MENPENFKTDPYYISHPWQMKIRLGQGLIAIGRGVDEDNIERRLVFNTLKEPGPIGIEIKEEDIDKLIEEPCFLQIIFTKSASVDVMLKHLEKIKASLLEHGC